MCISLVHLSGSSVVSQTLRIVRLCSPDSSRSSTGSRPSSPLVEYPPYPLALTSLRTVTVSFLVSRSTLRTHAHRRVLCLASGSLLRQRIQDDMGILGNSDAELMMTADVRRLRLTVISRRSLLLVP